VLTSHNPIAIKAQRPAAPIGAHRGTIGSSLKSATVRAPAGRPPIASPGLAAARSAASGPLIVCTGADRVRSFRLLTCAVPGARNKLGPELIGQPNVGATALSLGRSSHVRSPSRPARPHWLPKMKCVSIFSPTSSARTPACIGREALLRVAILARICAPPTSSL
jgi:hypothetical protein